MAAHTASGGDAAGDTLTSIENLIGSDHADTLTGDNEANLIDGGAGADTIDGGAGNDMLYGGNEATVAAGELDPLELITDGSFDILSKGTVKDSTWKHVHPSEESHWKATNGNANQNGKAEVFNEHNNNFVEIDVAGKTDALSQTIATTENTEYVLTFKAVARSNDGVDANELLIVRIAGDEYVCTKL